MCEIFLSFKAFKHSANSKGTIPSKRSWSKSGGSQIKHQNVLVFQSVGTVSLLHNNDYVPVLSEHEPCALVLS